MKSLQKLFEVSLLITALGVFCQSCRKDPGNYVYKEVNEATVTGLDSFYVVTKGEVLQITPIIGYTQDKIGDTVNYEYAWLWINKDGDKPRIPQKIGTMPILKARMNNPLGLYNYSFRVTDKRTGIWKEYYFKVLINNKFYEGWYLLSETKGQQSRLDMLNYKAESKKYEFIPDILTAAGSALKLKGTPSLISYFRSNGIPSLTEGGGEAIVVGTSEMATFLGTDSLQYLPSYDFSSFVLNQKNVAIGKGSKIYAADPYVFLWANGKAYSNTSNGILSEISRIGPGDLFLPPPSFIAAPFIAGTNSAVLFDETSSEFVWYPGNSANSCYPLPNEETLFKNKIDKNLLFMKLVENSKNEVFAILKDKIGDKVYLAKFTAEKQNYFAEITNTPIAQATHFEISSDFGYIFYSVGNKVYSYDANLKLNKEMLDYGNRRISLLKFEKINSNTPNERYAAIGKHLCICTYDEADLSGSGSFEIYSVPPANAELVKEESFSGMGKVISICYRTR